MGYHSTDSSLYYSKLFVFVVFVFSAAFQLVLYFIRTDALNLALFFFFSFMSVLHWKALKISHQARSVPHSPPVSKEKIIFVDGYPVDVIQTHTGVSFQFRPHDYPNSYNAYVASCELWEMCHDGFQFHDGDRFVTVPDLGIVKAPQEPTDG